MAIKICNSKLHTSAATTEAMTCRRSLLCCKLLYIQSKLSKCNPKITVQDGRYQKWRIATQVEIVDAKAIPILGELKMDSRFIPLLIIGCGLRLFIIQLLFEWNVRLQCTRDHDWVKNASSLRKLKNRVENISFDSFLWV